MIAATSRAAAPEYTFDLDGMYELVAGDPTDEAVAEAIKLLYLVSTVAECCGDEAMDQLLSSDSGFAPSTTGAVPADPLALEQAWDRLGASTLRSWDNLTTGLERWFTWTGDFTGVDLDEVRVAAPFTTPWRATQPAYVPAGDRVAHAGTSGLAVTALVLALVGVGVLAIVFGHAARTNINRTGRTGDGLAVAALVLGYLEIAAALIVGIALSA